ncbi:MAG: phospholipase D-like domain-containing protein [Candidatus Bipolaricaulaceae bacterium]
MMKNKVFLVAILFFVSIQTWASCPCSSVEAFFVSPTTPHIIETRLIALLDQSTKTVDIAMYSFTDDDLGNAVARAHTRGVKVRVILDDTQKGAAGSELNKLVEAGIPVRIATSSGSFHHKFVILDGTVVVTGSYNWSEAAGIRNWENIVVLKCEELAKVFTAIFEVLWTAFEGNEARKCQAISSKTFLSFPSLGGTDQISISINQDCGWTVTVTCPWVSVFPGSGSGPGQVRVNVSPNTSPMGRTCTITIANTNISVFQQGTGIKTRDEECLERLNRVSFGQLVDCPGIGEIIATRVINNRPFTSLRQLTAIHGIGQARCCYILRCIGCEDLCNKYCQ